MSAEEQLYAAVEAELIALRADNATLRDHGQFLLERLDDFERGAIGECFDDRLRDWEGHVAPALARLRAALAGHEQAVTGSKEEIEPGRWVDVDPAVVAAEQMDDFIRAVLAGNNPRSDEPYKTVGRHIRGMHRQILAFSRKGEG